MSKAVRLGVWVLAVLVLASAAVAVVALMQKQTLQGQNNNLHAQITDAQNKMDQLQATIKKLQNDAQDLNTKISQTQQEKAQVQSLYDELKTKSTDLQSQLDQANTDRDDWKNRTDTVTHQRDDWKNRADTVTHQRDDVMQKLKDWMQKFKNRPTIEKIVYKDRIVKVPVPAEPAAPDLASPVKQLTNGKGGMVPMPSSSGSMELPPIIVNAPANPPAPVAAPAVAPAAARAVAVALPLLKVQGSIISINNDSNFIIADLGQANSAVKVGSVLKVYRQGSQEIATLEVIQVRRDICAADIKNKSTEPNVGDIVKLI